MRLLILVGARSGLYSPEKERTPNSPDYLEIRADPFSTLEELNEDLLRRKLVEKK